MKLNNTEWKIKKVTGTNGIAVPHDHNDNGSDIKYYKCLDAFTYRRNDNINLNSTNLRLWSKSNECPWGIACIKESATSKYANDNLVKYSDLEKRYLLSIQVKKSIHGIPYVVVCPSVWDLTYPGTTPQDIDNYISNTLAPIDFTDQCSIYTSGDYDIMDIALPPTYTIGLYSGNEYNQTSYIKTAHDTFSVENYCFIGDTYVLHALDDNSYLDVCKRYKIGLPDFIYQIY